jgi:hypothetical protein
MFCVCGHIFSSLGKAQEWNCWPHRNYGLTLRDYQVLSVAGVSLYSPMFLPILTSTFVRAHPVGMRWSLLVV